MLIMVIGDNTGRTVEHDSRNTHEIKQKSWTVVCCKRTGGSKRTGGFQSSNTGTSAVI